MATNPIGAGFVPANADANPWLDEIDHALARHHHFDRLAREVPADETEAFARWLAYRASVRRLAKLGVTVSGGIGHA